jgi:hypothetical protein
MTMKIYHAVYALQLIVVQKNEIIHISAVAKIQLVKPSTVRCGVTQPVAIIQHLPPKFFQLFCQTS